MNTTRPEQLAGKTMGCLTFKCSNLVRHVPLRTECGCGGKLEKMRHGKEHWATCDTCGRMDHILEKTL